LHPRLRTRPAQEPPQFNFLFGPSDLSARPPAPSGVPPPLFNARGRLGMRINWLDFLPFHNPAHDSHFPPPLFSLFFVNCLPLNRCPSRFSFAGCSPETGCPELFPVFAADPCLEPSPLPQSDLCFLWSHLVLSFLFPGRFLLDPGLPLLSESVLRAKTH